MIKTLDELIRVLDTMRMHEPEITYCDESHVWIISFSKNPSTSSNVKLVAAIESAARKFRISI